jgi:hypothetical protein
MPMRREQIAAALQYLGEKTKVLQDQQSPEQSERQRIEAEIRQTPWFKEFVTQYKEEPNLSPSADYDYITAWKAGIRPERDPNDQNRYHWSSKTPEGVMLKKPEHPTLWKTNFMDQTGQNPDAIGVKTEQQAQEWLRTRGRK